MSRLKAVLLLVTLWAGIYLPGLGSLELRGEEGRRILPALDMIKTGEWIVPYVGGRPYLRKPPLVNWLIAGAFTTTGRINEWAARLPSVLAVLSLVLVAALVIPDAKTGFLAAFFMLTNIGLIEKGRLAEIEALYIALSGIAMLCWLNWWRIRTSPWLLWMVPCFFLGLGLLAKSPLHLLFFYSLVLIVLWRAKELKLLLHPAHWAGLVLMGGLFALWAIPYFQKVAGLNAAQVWGAQFAGRLTGEFDFVGWITNIPRGLMNFLPWVLFAPLFWTTRIEGDRRLEVVFGAARLGSTLCFFGLLILPGVLPRYTLPLVAPLGLVFAEAVLRADPRSLRFWRGLALASPSASPVTLAVRTGLPMVVVACIYGFLAIPKMNAAGGLRLLANRIESSVPSGETLYVLDPGYMPALFYLQLPYECVPEVGLLPQKAGVVLASKPVLRKLRKKQAEFSELAHFTSGKGDSCFLLRLQKGK